MSKRSTVFAAVTAFMVVMMLTLARARAAAEQGRKVSQSDMAFILKAGEGGEAEVAMGKLAEEKGNSTEVKAFGKKMVEDHSQVNEKLAKLAKDRDVQLSHELKGETKSAYDVLASLSGPEFDKHYIHHMIKAHEEDLTLFKTEASSGNDEHLKEFAGNTVKMIEHHLALAKEIATKIGAEQ